MFIGDPAQCVEEGVDFRFEEIRSVVHKLSCGQESVNKPLKLLVNYRSHSGILNCASAVLGMMFSMFPGSAKILPKDTGLYQGPRPVYFQTSNCCRSKDMMSSSSDELIHILKSNEKLVVICPDDVAAKTERILKENEVHNIVLGIREAKGLEFSDVVLVDFFSCIPLVDQKAWKIVLGLGGGESKSVAKEYEFPQLETQLKKLYTAITRCCNRLLFFESKPSQAGSAFFRMLGSKHLGERFSFSVLEGEKGSMVHMTSDEWRVRGIEFALSAEGEVVESFLRRAVMCFDRAGDYDLKEKASAHQEVEAMKRRVLNRCEGRDEGVGALTPLDEMDAAHAVLRGIKSRILSETYTLSLLVAQCYSDEHIFHKEVMSEFLIK